MVQDCRLSVGVTDERCSLSTLNSITAFFSNAYPAKCSLERLTLQADESANDVAIHGFLTSIKNKHANTIQHLSLEGSGLQQKGVSLLCDIMRKGSLKSLQHLNVSRNKALYHGVHKLSKTIAQGHVPHLSTLNISSNDAKHAVLDFFDKRFADATPFLKHLIAQSNLLDIYDADVMAQRLRGSGKLCWHNFHTLDLSHNCLVDVELAKMISQQVWVMADLPVDKEGGNFTRRSELRHLHLQEIELGNHTCRVLSELMTKGYFPHLQTLDVSANAISSEGVDRLLEPLRRSELAELRTLNLGLNKIHHDGVLLIASSQNLGVFDKLEELDMSDVGCNSETIALFAKALVTRFERKSLQNLRRLKVIGLHPYAGKNVRLWFPEAFLIRVRVT